MKKDVVNYTYCYMNNLIQHFVKHIYPYNLARYSIQTHLGVNYKPLVLRKLCDGCICSIGVSLLMWYLQMYLVRQLIILSSYK